MDITVCDISAFQFWRVPPVVRLLAGAPEGDDDLCRYFDPDKVLALRMEMASSLPLCRACLRDGKRWRCFADVASAVRDASIFLSAGIDRPVDLLFDSVNELHTSGVYHGRVLSCGLLPGERLQVADGLSVVSPAFALQQLATRASLTRTVMLASEVCGSFAVYRAPAPIAGFLQRQLSAGRLPNYGGWSTCVSSTGKLTDLWRREPLLTPSELAKSAGLSDSGRGRKRLLRAAELVVPDAASPFEARAGMLLGLSKRLGGEGLGGFAHNKKIELSGQARLLAGRNCCYGDLVWDEGLDLECQGADFHDNARSYLSDSERTAALELMGYRVLPVTHEQLRSPARLDALAEVVSMILGVRRVPKTEAQRDSERKLRDELFEDWYRLPFE